ncbi:MAG TPA: hypothetical protein DCL54_09095 [Alphaproteobacteria bacterium]|nr:hypothetical protein [Alphaproteobacteria bacterium]HAJ46720.1 hypothetical protein [Alphaproteobacteria bacterium]
MLKSLLLGSVLGAWAAFAAPTMAQTTVTPDQIKEDANDPYEDINRAFFGLNEVLDDIFLRPAAVTYRAVIPQYGRDRVRNVLNNLDSPVVFANDVLQGEGDRAGTTVMRFLLNSTFGVLGIWDVATDWGFPFHDEDFGQTLAVWGVDEGPYWYVPLLGPSNPRDSVGRLVDIGLDPVTYVTWGDDYEWVPFARTAINIIDLRSRNIETLDAIERDSIDYYASVRSLYRQFRKDAINNGEPSADLPEFDANIR